MYRMAILALCSDRTDLNISRCVELAVVHDLAEAIAGDLVVGQGTTSAEKAALEEVRAASEQPHLRRLRWSACSPRCCPPAQQPRSAYERSGESMRIDKQPRASLSRIVRAASSLKLTASVDRFELGLQAVEYEGRGIDGRT